MPELPIPGRPAYEIAAPPIDPPPTQEDLPYDDGVPMESQRHKMQMDLLMEPLRVWLAHRPDGGYVGGNMFVYYSLEQARRLDFRGPDVFVVLGVSSHERKSWVVWEEGKVPDIIIELLSTSTLRTDKVDKKQVYQDRLRVPEYFWFDPFQPDDFAGFALNGGSYTPIARDAQQRLVSRRIGLALVRWRGPYQGIEATWLRWSELNGTLLQTAEEHARQAQEQASQAQEQASQAQEHARQAQEHARQAQEQASQAEQRACQAEERAEQEQTTRRQAEQRAEQMAARLRALGIDPDVPDTPAASSPQ